MAEPMSDVATRAGDRVDSSRNSSGVKRKREEFEQPSEDAKSSNSSASNSSGSVSAMMAAEPHAPRVLKGCVHHKSLPRPLSTMDGDRASPANEISASSAADSKHSEAGAESKEPAKTWPFTLDDFQKVWHSRITTLTEATCSPQKSIECLEMRHNVLVAAHTSAGKTVIAEYAIALALRSKSRVIYTA